MIQNERVHVLSQGTAGGAAGGANEGSCVLYWMQRSQRESCNHALEYAVEQANSRGLPLFVLFVLTPAYPEAVLRHYRFMLEGIAVASRRIRARGIGFRLRIGDPTELVPAEAKRAVLLVGDRAYLRPTRVWRRGIASRIAIPYHEVESDVVVPVQTASEKEEYSAGTFRPKIHRRLFRFLVPLERRKVLRPWEERPGTTAGPHTGPAENTDDIDGLLAKIAPDPSVGPAAGFPGGEEEAQRRLELFIERDLQHFDELRNNPAEDHSSGLSPYLHFGQISPLTIALAALERKDIPTEGFLEELVVRRELAFNFTWYDSAYDRLECLPRWARESLEVHEADMREPEYSLAQLEAADTYDPYWNAAQKELVTTGKMHGYLRMYWGKKILEWAPTVREAFQWALSLNNRYALDGRDPNSYAGIAWCFGKHDRAWTERKIFGKVRYMNDRGLERKFKIAEYVRRVEELSRLAPL